MAPKRMSGISGVTWALVIVLLVNGSVALAQSYDPEQTVPKPTLFEKRLNKFARGVTNILFGWAEIPKTFDQKLKEGKPLTYLLAGAPIVGTVKALIRTGTGVYEVATFRSTKPNVNYEPILKPEYIF